MKARIIDGVHKGKGRAMPQSFWTLCATQLNKVFSEIIHDYDLLKNCYCSIRSRDFDEEFITEITTGIPTAVLCNGTTDPNNFLRENLINAHLPQPYLILNDVGTGKSTYLHHYFLVRVKEYNLEDKIEAILINLKEMGLSDNVIFNELEEFIHHKIDTYLKQKHSKISTPDLEIGSEIFWEYLAPYAKLIQFKKQKGQDVYEEYLVNKIDELIKDVKIFNRARIKYLREKKNKNIFIVIDNVDHYGRTVQEYIFSLSTKLLNELSSNIIMSARDYTVPSIFRHIPLSAFEPRFLHLALPDTKALLQKRISYLFETNFIDKIFNIIGKNQIEVYSPTGTKYIFDKKTLEKEFENVLQALLKDKDIIYMLETLSDYDMRAMLKMVRVSLSSGYLLPDDREDTNCVRARDFLRAIICGNNPYFFPNDPSSMVINLFDNGEPNYEGNNLIRLRTLQTIKVLGDNAGVHDVIRFMKLMGYAEERIIEILQLFMNVDLIESPFYEGTDIRKDNVQIVKLTYAGEFYLSKLISYDIVYATYIDEIKNATFLDQSYIREISEYLNMGKSKEISKKERIESRLLATELFIKALRKEEDLESQRIHRNPEAYDHYDALKDTISNLYKNFLKAKENILNSID